MSCYETFWRSWHDMNIMIRLHSRKRHCIVNVKMNVKGFIISSRSFYSSQWKRIPCHWVAVVLLFFLRLRLCPLTGTGLSSSRTKMRLDITKWESAASMELHSLHPGNDSLKTTNFECSNERRKRGVHSLLRAFDCTQPHWDDSEGFCVFSSTSANTFGTQYSLSLYEN